MCKLYYYENCYDFESEQEEKERQILFEKIVDFCYEKKIIIIQSLGLDTIRKQVITEDLFVGTKRKLEQLHNKFYSNYSFDIQHVKRKIIREYKTIRKKHGVKLWKE